MSDWRRVSLALPCPVCGKPDWCLVAGPPGKPTAAICPRTKSQRRAGDAGWLHVLRKDGDKRTGRSRRVVIRGRPDNGNIEAEAQRAVKWVQQQPSVLGQLAGQLGLSTESLRRLQVGYCCQHRAWTFPMRSADGQIIGIRLRLADGRKLSLRGGHEGLFLPEGIEHGGQLLIAEGPTDCAALLDLGFQAVGRPSCTGGSKLLVDLLKRLQPKQVVIVADQDEPGQQGAHKLACELVVYCRALKLIRPPADIKDARQWRQGGATQQDVQAAIDTAARWQVRITIREKGENHVGKHSNQ